MSSETRTHPPPAAAPLARHCPGHWSVRLGILLLVLGPALVGTLIWSGPLAALWCLPLCATAGLGLFAFSLVRQRTLGRALGLGVAGLFAGAGWYLLAPTLLPPAAPDASEEVISFLLPPYAGPLVIGQPFPAFATTLSDGSTFTPESLRTGGATVMVFFRGKW
jgi:hypothetical protein